MYSHKRKKSTTGNRMDLLNAKKRQIGGAKYYSHKAADGVKNAEPKITIQSPPEITLTAKDSYVPPNNGFTAGVPGYNTLKVHYDTAGIPTHFVNQIGQVMPYSANPVFTKEFAYPAKKYSAPKGRNGIKNASGGASTALMDPYSADDDQPRKVFAAGGVKHQAMDDPEFNSVLESLSKKSGINKDWVNRLIHIESGGDPSAHNPHGSASGIVQMIDATAKAMGTSAEELRHMTASEQLPFAFKYWNQYKDKIKQPSDLYIANMYPAALGKSDDYAIGTDQQSRAKLAKLNPAIDVDKDQQITVGEIRRWFDPSYKSKMTPPGLPQNLTPSLADMTSYQKSNRELEIPGKTTLFPVQRTTLPSLNKPLPKTPTTGTRSAGEGIEQDTPNMDDWMQLYNKPDLAGDVNFVSNLFKM